MAICSIEHNNEKNKLNPTPMNTTLNNYNSQQIT